MSCKILINAADPDECRIAKVKDSKLEEFHIASSAREITQGNIYKGIITHIEPGLQAAFVDYGAERHGFLQKHEIHRDYFQDTHDGNLSIKNVVKRGQEVIVQVTKDPIMNKGAMVTTFISLAGRYMVLMPGSKNQGISRKIEDEDDRNRIREIIGILKCPEGFGLIVRTAAVNSNKTDLTKDLKYLLQLWKNIKKKGMEEKAPALLYKERSFTVRSIRDYFTPDVSEILIDDGEVFNEVKEFITVISPKHLKIVKLHKNEKPIFTKYQLENQIASIFESRVPLKSGGSIVITQTEALVAVDVNSGKGSHKESIGQTAFSTNMEAAEEIAKQLRLRDLGGLIVIDFIDMKEIKHKLAVERAIKAELKKDKARSTVGKISKFGLLEMSRQRIRPSIEYGTYEPCKHCHGKGIIPSTETLGLSVLRKLSLETLKEDIKTVTSVVPADVADYLLNSKRREILDLELRRNLSIIIAGDRMMIPGQSKIICEK